MPIINPDRFRDCRSTHTKPYGGTSAKALTAYQTINSLPLRDIETEQLLRDFILSLMTQKAISEIRDLDDWTTAYLAARAIDFCGADPDRIVGKAILMLG